MERVQRSAKALGTIDDQGRSRSRPDGVFPTALQADGRPRPLECRQRASALTDGMPLELRGEDREITRFGPLSSLPPGDDACVLLSYLSSARWANELDGRRGQVVITREELVAQVPRGNSVLITNLDPREVFYGLFSERAVPSYERLASWIHPDARIEPSAVVASNVWVESDVYVGHNAVVMPNTYLGRGVTIKPNATLGGDGFEPKSTGELFRVVPHAGGVWLDDGVEIGSSTCVDRGLFGEFTYLGRDTKVDNLVHVAHSVITGTRVCLVACSEISGTVTIEDGVWVGPNASVNQLLRLGAHSYIGTASVVTRNLERHSLVYGAPAKRTAWVCVCREKLAFNESMQSECSCGRRFEIVNEVPTMRS